MKFSPTRNQVLTRDNTDTYTPSADYHPSTKKYVDDNTTSGSAYIFISSTTATDVASVSFTNLSSTYAKYVLEFIDYIPETDTTDIIIRTSSDNGSNYDVGASDYSWAIEYFGMGTASGSVNDGADTGIKIFPAAGNVGAEKVNGSIEITSHDTTKYTSVSYHGVGQSADGFNYSYVGGGVRLSAADVDAIQVLSSSGNINGIFKLYGIKAS